MCSGVAEMENTPKATKALSPSAQFRSRAEFPRFFHVEVPSLFCFVSGINPLKCTKIYLVFTIWLILLKVLHTLGKIQPVNSPLCRSI